MRKMGAKFLAMAVMGASLAFTASAALADGDVTTPGWWNGGDVSNVTVHPAPAVLQPAPANRGTVAGTSQEPYVGPYFQMRLDNMGR